MKKLSELEDNFIDATLDRVNDLKGKVLKLQSDRQEELIKLSIATTTCGEEIKSFKTELRKNLDLDKMEKCAIDDLNKFSDQHK